MERDYRRSRSSSRNRRSYNNAYYNNSSVAYDYSETIHYEPRRKQNIARKKKLKKNKIQIVNEQTVHSFRVYFTVFTLFCFSVFVIASNAAVTEQKSMITELKENLKQIQEDNTYLETELTKNLDLTEVEKLASLKLGMQKPASHQIVYIDVPHQSYTIKHENKANFNEGNNNINFIQYIKNILRID